MSTLRLTDADGVRTIELNRPEALNALNAQMTDDLTDAFREVADDASVKVILLTGAGKAFWAGADLKEMGNPPRDARHTFADMMDAIIDLPKPLLIAVNGVGVGIGATICGLGDIVIMGASARLRCPFSTLGLTAEAASTVTFPQLMGHQRASWFLLSAEWMSAQECVNAGLAMEMVGDEQLLEVALGRARQLAALPTSSLQMTKSLLRQTLADSLKAAIRRENAGLGQLVGSPANREAVAAFMEKRPPDFSQL